MTVPPSTPLRLTFYTKPGCHLCDDMRDALRRAAVHVPLAIDEIDITTDAGLTDRWGTEIPVLLAGGQELARHRVTDVHLLETLKRAFQDRSARRG